MIAGLLGAATVLIRSVGVGVVVAVFLCFLKERQWKQLSAFTVVVADRYRTVVDVLARSRADGGAPADSSRAARLRVRRSVLDAFRGLGVIRPSDGGRSAGQSCHQSDRCVRHAASLGFSAPPSARPRRKRRGSLFTSEARSDGQFVGFGGLQSNHGASVAAWRHHRVGIRPDRARASDRGGVLVPISLLITLLWPFWSFRFVLPLTPFSIPVFREGPDPGPASARVALLVVISLNLYDHAGYVALARSDPVEGRRLGQRAFDELDTTLDWMKTHLEPDAVVASTNPALVHLTNRS